MSDGGGLQDSLREGATRLAKALTPNLQPDPRAALRDMRVKEPLRTVLKDPARSAGLQLEDGSADDPYADAEGNTLKRHFSVLRSATDEVVLLQIPDWLANDGANVGALDEMRDAFANRKVRIVAEQVLTPSLSLDKTLPRIWRDRAKIAVEFVSWRYVAEMQQGKLKPDQVFGLAAGAAPAPQPAPAGAKIRSVFIGSTGMDLREYRETARKVCNELHLVPIMMEDFDAMGLGATAGSKLKLDRADLYVGIFAYRYGYIEEGHSRSVTEIEFDYAAERGIERLCFVVDPKYSWPTDTWDPEHREQMDALKKRVEALVRGQFTTTDNFKAMLTQALALRLLGS